MRPGPLPGNEARPAEARGSGPALPFVLLGMGLLAVGLWVWHPLPAGIWHDDGVYVLLGRSLARGHGLVYDGVPGAPPAVKFAPGYPAFLAGLWLVFGSLARTTVAAEIVNLMAVAAAAAVFAHWLRRTCGWSVAASLAVSGAAWASADIWRFAMVPLSEPLFLLAAVVSLTLAAEAARSRRRSTAVLTGLALAAAMLLRTAGASLVIAVVGGLLVRRQRIAAALAAAPPAAVWVGWSAWVAWKAPTVPPALDDILGPYASWFARQVATHPMDFMARLPAHVTEMWLRIAGMALPGAPADAAPLLFVPVAALAIGGLWALRRRAPELGLLVVAYLAMLAVWPYVDSRLLAPVVPLGVAAPLALFLAVRDQAGAGAPSRSAWTRRAVPLLTLAWLAAYSVGTVRRLASDWPTRAYGVRASRLADALSAMDATVGDGEPVVGAPEFWPAVILHRGWSAAPSARFRPGEVPPWGDPESQLRLWSATGVDHLLLEQGGLVHGDALNLLEETCPGSVWILRRLKGQLWVRLTWDEACRSAVAGS